MTYSRTRFLSVAMMITATFFFSGCAEESNVELEDSDTVEMNLLTINQSASDLSCVDKKVVDEDQDNGDGDEECDIAEPIIIGEPGYCYFDCMGYCAEETPCVWTDGRTSKHAIRKVKLKPGKTCDDLAAAREGACNCDGC